MRDLVASVRGLSVQLVVQARDFDLPPGYHENGLNVD